MITRSLKPVRLSSFTANLAERDNQGMPGMTILQMIEEWEKGCSNGSKAHPENCTSCTLGLINAIRAYELSEVVKRKRLIPGMEASMQLIEGGSFMHDQAPPKLFAAEVTTMLKREINKL